MSKLGELLKSEREKKGLSLHEIGMSLKINAKILKAIEDGDEKNLPAKTFLRGFVKSYAQYLRLDINHLMQMFQEEYGSTRPEEPKKTLAAPPGAPDNSAAPTVSTGPKFESSLRRSEDAALPASSSNRVYTILGAIVLLVLIAFVAKMMDKYHKESRVSKTEVIAAVEAEKKTETSIEPTKPETLIQEPLATPISGPIESTTSTTSSVPTTMMSPASALPIITTTTAVTTTTTTSTTLKPTTTTTTIAETTTSTLKIKTTEVIVEALSKITVKFTLNDGKQEVLELNPDEVHTLRSKGPIQLEVSDGGAVNIILNGRDKGVPGTIGKPIKLTY